MLSRKKREKTSNLFGSLLPQKKIFSVENPIQEWEFLVDPRYSSQDDRHEHYVGTFLKGKQLSYFWWILFSLFIFLTGKIIFLQIIQGEKYRSLAEGNRTKMVVSKAQRGLLYDRNGYLLVQNVPGFILALQTNFLPQPPLREKYLEELSFILEEPKEVLEEQIASHKNSIFPIILNENIPYEKAILLETQKERFPGIILEVVSFRQYFPVKNLPVPKSLSHVLGYTGLLNQEELKKFDSIDYAFTDVAGKAGLEKYYEKELKGKNGLLEIEVDALGREKKIYKNAPSVSRINLTLSLDLILQAKAEEITLLHLKKEKKDKASVVIMNPKNGEILALLSIPFYDNQSFSPKIQNEIYQDLILDKNQPLFNRAIAGEYPSGSTIKPILGFAALEEGIITPNTRVESKGGISVGQWFFPDWRLGGHGWVNIYDAIAFSVNTFFYFIGGGYGDFRGLGVEKIIEYASHFGFGKPLGIDLPGEKGGLLPSPSWKEDTKHEPWYIGDTYHLSIGQGDLLATPLQIVAAMSVFANSGILYRPHFLQKEPEILHIFSQSHINVIREAMRETVLSGSARRFLTLPVSSAGKTGTAQWQNNKSPHAWFTAFAPYEAPELVIVVMVEEGGGGEKVALPIAYDIFSWYFGEYKKAENSDLFDEK